MLNTGSRQFEEINKQVLVTSGEIDPSRSCDPHDPDCAPGIRDFYKNLLSAVVHWVWDYEDEDPLYPDFPYDAHTSFRIEQASIPTPALSLGLNPYPQASICTPALSLGLNPHPCPIPRPTRTGSRGTAWQSGPSTSRTWSSGGSTSRC